MVIRVFLSCINLILKFCEHILSSFDLFEAYYQIILINSKLFSVIKEDLIVKSFHFSLALLFQV